MPILVWVAGSGWLVQNVGVFAEGLESVFAFAVTLFELYRVVWRDCLSHLRY